MEDVKVGEQFSLPVSINNRGAIVQSEGSPINDLKLDLMVTCIAINNHDRLVEENSELRKQLKDSHEWLGINADYKDSPLCVNNENLLNK